MSCTGSCVWVMLKLVHSLCFYICPYVGVCPFLESGTFERRFQKWSHDGCSSHGSYTICRALMTELPSWLPFQGVIGSFTCEGPLLLLLYVYSTQKGPSHCEKWRAHRVETHTFSKGELNLALGIIAEKGSFLYRRVWKKCCKVHKLAIIEIFHLRYSFFWILLLRTSFQEIRQWKNVLAGSRGPITYFYFFPDRHISLINGHHTNRYG